jgi:hypothetical protein
MLPHSCVCVLTVGLPDPSRQTARPDAGDGWSGGIVLASGQNRPERNPAERPGKDVLARRANRGPGCYAAVRPHGRMRDGPKGRSPLRHAKPSWGGRKARATVDVQGLRFRLYGLLLQAFDVMGGKRTCGGAAQLPHHYLSARIKCWRTDSTIVPRDRKSCERAQHGGRTTPPSNFERPS